MYPNPALSLPVWGQRREKSCTRGPSALSWIRASRIIPASWIHWQLSDEEVTFCCSMYSSMNPETASQTLRTSARRKLIESASDNWTMLLFVVCSNRSPRHSESENTCSSLLRWSDRWEYPPFFQQCQIDRSADNLSACTGGKTNNRTPRQTV